MSHNKTFFFFQQTSPFGHDKNSTDNPSMGDYLSAIDPIELKYAISDDKPLPLAAKSVATTFEDKFQYSSYTKKEYSYILENLRLVYGDGENTIKNDIVLFHLVESKLICKYFGIPQLNRMFDEDYFQFEWDMHVGQNFTDHVSDYYRDHFIHQIRNLHMMLVLLDRYGFYEACVEIFKNRSGSKVSEFVFKKHLDFCDNHFDQQQKLLEKIYESYKKDLAISQEEYAEAYFYKYITYASTMLCALFHDMGYPVCHFLGVRQRLSEYNPAMYNFTHNAVESFDQLAFKLGSSLLFSVVSPAVIRRRLEPQKNGKYDHGAYSAIAFLLEFYETGVIYSLSAEKQCAIELAALAIYNHTSKFKAISKKDDTTYFNMYFQQNPISFLLRFCDDMQEWDRRYFEITMTGDLLFCPKCGFPLLKQKDPLKDSDFYPGIRYKCGCRSSEEIKMSRPEIFIRRKMYLVTVSNWVKLFYNSTGDTPNSKELVAEIDYDLYKLLILSKANCSYAKHRKKELGYLQKLLKYQEYNPVTNGKLDFYNIRLKSFMSANPLLIKIKILDLFLRLNNLYPKDTNSAADGQPDYSVEDLAEKPENSYSENMQTEAAPEPLADVSVDQIFAILDQCRKVPQRGREESLPFLNGHNAVQNQNSHTSEERDFNDIGQSADQEEGETKPVDVRSDTGTTEAAQYAELREFLQGTTTPTVAGALDFYLLLLKDCLEGKQTASQRVRNYVENRKPQDSSYCEIMNHLIADCLQNFNTEESIKLDKDNSCEDALYQCVERYTNDQNGFNKYHQPTANPPKYPYIGYFKDIYFFYLLHNANMKAIRKLNAEA